jgi:hypothetical protein
VSHFRSRKNLVDPLCYELAKVGTFLGSQGSQGLECGREEYVILDRGFNPVPDSIVGQLFPSVGEVATASRTAARRSRRFALRDFV